MERVVDVSMKRMGALERLLRDHKIVILSGMVGLVSQTAAMILTKLYFVGGGHSKWLSALTQVGGWPVTLLLLLIFNRNNRLGFAPTPPKLAMCFLGLGLLLAGTLLLYTWGASLIPASTFALLTSTSLAFTAFFSYFINKQRITQHTANSIAFITTSAIILGLDGYSGKGDKGGSAHRGDYIKGFLCTLGASALASLNMPLWQLAFDKYVHEPRYCAVVQGQIVMSVIGSVVFLVGLIASGDYHCLSKEMQVFHDGKVAYVMYLVFAAVACQSCPLGFFVLVLRESPLFSTVVSTLTIPTVPLLSIFLLNEKMSTAKILSLVLTVWGFGSFCYSKYRNP